MIFFFDRNISVHLARMISAFDRDNQIEHQDWDARFTPATSDVTLIAELARDAPRPVLVTADTSQRRRPAERAALRGSGMTVVFFRSGFFDLTFHQQAIKLVWIWPSIVNACARCKAPTVFEIPPRINSDKVENLGPTIHL